MVKKYVIGIDLGGTKICGALADINGNVISIHTIPTNASEGEQAVLERIFSVIEKVLTDSGKSIENVKAIGIGSPGPLDSKMGMILDTPNLPFKHFGIVKHIEEKFNVVTYLENDANAAAIGEYMFGAGKGTQNMVYVTVSTGVGGGAVLNGKLYSGSTSNALEIGHTTVLPFGPKCKCGNYGCVEALSSGTAIGRQAKEAIALGLKTTLSNYDNVTSYEVFRESEKGDEVACDILNKSLTYLGIAITNVILNFDPEMVVIGGGVSKGGQIVFDKVREVVNTRILSSMKGQCEIVPAGLGTDAGVMGAIAVAITESK